MQQFEGCYTQYDELQKIGGEAIFPLQTVEAVKASDTKVIVPLACMNVIMPTAMSSIHKDEELKESAWKTATNGKKKIKSILKVCKLKMNRIHLIWLR